MVTICTVKAVQEPKLTEEQLLAKNLSIEDFTAVRKYKEEIVEYLEKCDYPFEIVGVIGHYQKLIEEILNRYRK